MIGAIFTVLSYNTQAAITESIDYKGQFTTVIDNPSKDIGKLHFALLCLDIHNHGLITHACILKKNQKVATGQTRIKGVDTISLPDISITQLLRNIPKKLQRHVKNSFVSGYKKVSPRAGEELFIALLKVCSNEDRESIKTLYNKTKKNRNPVMSGRHAIDVALEKDATGISLDIFGIDRKQILESWKEGMGNSFLSGLQSYVAYEDDIISHDLNTAFSGWKIEASDITGVTNFKKNGQNLTVINANRKPLERAMGVDLIYFHRKYESFTFVQYKMMDNMTEDSRQMYYNPNQKSHTKELERMKKLLALIRKEPLKKDLKNYRLSSCPIFFKLCSKISFEPYDGGLITGAYIPIDEWEILITDESTKGPKGGVQISYHTLKSRYLRTSAFTELVQDGFLGTQSSHKLGLFIEAAIQNGHSVICAIEGE